MPKYKRRQYFIDKKLQTKYILLTVTLLIVYSFLFAAIIFAPHIFGLAAAETLKEQADAARALLSLHKIVWPALGIVIIVLGVISIFVTHKIAGPVYRFKKVLAEVSAGNLDISVRLRKRDDLKDLAEDMNTVIEELRIFVSTLKEDHATMSSCIEELEEKIRKNQISTETGNELIAKLKSSTEKTAKTLKKYSN